MSKIWKLFKYKLYILFKYKLYIMFKLRLLNSHFYFKWKATMNLMVSFRRVQKESDELLYTWTVVNAKGLGGLLSPIEV